MKIYYQGYPGAYGNKASIKVAEVLKMDFKNIIGVQNFKEVFLEIDKGNIGVLPIENSYAGSIHENFYHIIGGNYKIIGEIFLDINHFLLANTYNISDVKEVYSHPQALMQCQNYLNNNGLKSVAMGDTAGAAKFVLESKRNDIASISSDLCSNIYGLNILQENIQDQTGNTTRFFILINNELYSKGSSYFSDEFKIFSTGKISIKFKTKDTPSALYKCLGAFATRFINLTKIESLPAKENKFEYIFWIDFQKNVEDKVIFDALDELKYFCKELIILGNY